MFSSAYKPVNMLYTYALVAGRLCSGCKEGYEAVKESRVCKKCPDSKGANTIYYLLILCISITIIINIIRAVLPGSDRNETHKEAIAIHQSQRMPKPAVSVDDFIDTQSMSSITDMCRQSRTTPDVPHAVAVHISAQSGVHAQSPLSRLSRPQAVFAEPTSTGTAELSPNTEAYRFLPFQAAPEPYEEAIPQRDCSVPGAVAEVPDESAKISRVSESMKTTSGAQPIAESVEERISNKQGDLRGRLDQQSINASGRLEAASAGTSRGGKEVVESEEEEEEGDGVYRGGEQFNVFKILMNYLQVWLGWQSASVETFLPECTRAAGASTSM